MKIEVDEQCPDCGGTGLYIGMAERDRGIGGREKWHDAKKYVQVEKESQMKRYEDYQQPVYYEDGNAVPPPGLADGIR